MKYIVLTVFISLIGCRNIQKTNNEISLEECYPLKVKIEIFDNEPYLKDSVVILRNYSPEDSLRKVFCNGDFVDIELENLIWESKYIKSYTEYLEKLNWNAIINYFQKEDEIVVNFFILQRENMRMVEYRTLLIDSNEIIGVKFFNWLDEFIPIEEIEKDNIIYGPDPSEMDSIYEY